MVVGDVELVALVDATVDLGELSELFPDTADWSLYLDEYPEVVDGSSFLAPCASFLLRAGGETVLVDTGVGPAGLLDWPTGDEGLPRGLAAEGVAPEDVTVVAAHAPPRRPRGLEHGSGRTRLLPERAVRRAP